MLWSLTCRSLCRHTFLFLLGQYLKVELLSSVGVLFFLTIWEIANCFPKWFHTFTFSLGIYKGSYLSKSSLMFVVVCLIYYSHFSGCYHLNVVFNMHFNRNGVEHFFMLIRYLYIFFVVIFYSYFCPIISLV